MGRLVARLVARLGVALALLAGGATLTPRAAEAQELARATRDRCIHSMVRIEVDTPQGTLSGSGTVLDARGYVLTNFHVAGHTDLRGGMPGTQHGQRYRIAVTRSERDEVQDEYVAELVRGNLVLDLALLRIVGRADGSPLGPTDTFTPMPLSGGLPELGTRVWALGFPAGVRTVNITAGQVAGFEANSDEVTSWLRTDTEFNPGNSGGALIDRECRLVGIPTAVSNNVEPIELARPSTRIPAAWLGALASGTTLTPERVEGILALSSLTELVDTHLGDSSSRSGELRFYAIPRERPAVVSVTPRLELGAVGSGGRVLRQSEGQVLITASDPASTLVAVVVPRGQSGGFPRVRIRYSPMARTAAPSAAPTALRGRVVREGDSCRTHVLVASEGTDLGALAQGLRDGTRSEADVRHALTAVIPVGDDGRFAHEVPAGRYVVAVLGPTLGTDAAPATVATRTVDVGASGADLGELHADACP